MKKLLAIIGILFAFVGVAFASHLTPDKIPAFEPYMRNMQCKIKRNWTPPNLNVHQPVILSYTIDRKGKITDAKIVQSSGFPQMDNSAIKALYNASPFGNLPKDYTKDSLTVKFRFDYSFRDTK